MWTVFSPSLVQAFFGTAEECFIYAEYLDAMGIDYSVERM